MQNNWFIDCHTCDTESICHPEFSSGSSDVVGILKQVQNDGVGLLNGSYGLREFALQILAMTSDYRNFTFAVQNSLFVTKMTKIKI